MPAPSAFPTHATIYRPFEEELEPSAPLTSSPEFTDGAVDVNIDADTDTRRFLIRWTGLTASEFSTLRAHMVSARYRPDVGSGYGFSFTTRAGEALAGVRYDRGGFTYSHVKTHIYSLQVVLVKRP